MQVRTASFKSASVLPRLGGLVSCLLAAAVALGGVAQAQSAQDASAVQAGAARASEAAASVDEAALIAAQLPSYPLKACVVSGESLADDTPIDVIQDGKLVRLCCKGCKRMLAKKPADILEQIDAAVVAAQKPAYPLKVCAVSGEDLESMGGALDVVHGTRLVRLCCKGCAKGLAKQPERALAKIDAALIESQKASYKLTTCPVSGDALEDPHDFLYGVQLVRTCCGGCEKAFRKDGETLIAKIEKARK